MDTSPQDLFILDNKPTQPGTKSSRQQDEKDDDRDVEGTDISDEAPESDDDGDSVGAWKGASLKTGGGSSRIKTTSQLSSEESSDEEDDDVVSSFPSTKASRLSTRVLTKAR